MNSQEFEQLITFWALKGKVSKPLMLGKKGFGEHTEQVKRITLITKKSRITVTYTVGEKITIIDYCNIVSSGLTGFYRGPDCMEYLEEM